MNFFSNKKGQGAIEFLSLFIVVFLFFTIFLLAVQENTNDKNVEKQNILANNIALTIQDEVNLAFNAPDGYYREFYLPTSIFGNDYDVSFVGNSVYLESNKIKLSYSIRSVEGEIRTGTNIITKTGGVVYVNFP